MSSNEVNWERFFLWSKDIIKSGLWSELSAPAKTVFPTIGAFRGNDGWCNPGHRKISQLSRCKDEQVRKAISELKDHEIIQTKWKKNKWGNTQLHFFIDCPAPEDTGKFFDFKNGLVKSEIWGNMLFESNSLYPVLRCYSYFNLELYYEIEKIDANLWNEDSMLKAYSIRKYDFFDLDQDVFIEKCGFGSKRDFDRAFDDLLKNKVVKIVKYEDEQLFLIFKKPYSI